MDKNQKALVLENYNNDIQSAIQALRVVEKPRPVPKPGQVLIQVKAAPCNPSDLLFLQNKYGVSKTLPAVPGWEGAGVVVESGGGALGWWLKDKRVAFVNQADRDGTWEEYCLADAKFCIPLREAIDFDQGSMLIINPFTAFGMVQMAKEAGHKGFVQSAAASQVGRMIIRLAAKEKIPLINIVRSAEQAALLKSLGAQHVLNSEDPTFYEELKKLAHQLSATCFFDAVAGPLTGIVLNALPKKALALVYGALSGKPASGFNPGALIFEMKEVKGFWLSKWLGNLGFFSRLKTIREVQILMEQGVLKSQIHRKVSLPEAIQALTSYSQKMTQGKVIINP
jgi:NADPH:quinone reductase-like Zn-dependent oxidoreductase